MLREYQEAAVAGAFAEWERVRSTLIVMATGTGKTIVVADIARRWITSGRGRVLVLAHREELIQQAKDKIRSFAGLESSIERADSYGDAGLWASPVVVATVQTLQRQSRLDRFGPDGFGLVVVDEAHHAPSDSYRAILAYFASARVLGVTATPDRADGAAMGRVFESVAFNYTIRDAIDEGHLVPIRQKAVQVESLDLSKVRTTAGDLNEGDLEKVLLEEENLHGIAHPTRELAGDRQTMIFCPTVDHAHSLAAVIDRARPGSARAVDGTTDHDVRRRTIEDFAAGRFQFLANCQIFLEGFDCPSIACVAMARPTKSRALYAQAIGRGTRLHPGKADLLVLDFAGNAGKHSLITAVDILAGDEDAEVREAARELAAGGEQTVDEAIESARTRVQEARRRALIAQAHYKAVEIDPFQILGATPRRTWWSGQLATDKQIQALRNSKVPVKQGMTKGEASALLDAVFGRREQGLCTYAQAKTLARHGLRPDVSFDEASSLIDRIAANNWKLPEDLKRTA